MGALAFIFHLWDITPLANMDEWFLFITPAGYLPFLQFIRFQGVLSHILLVYML